MMSSDFKTKICGTTSREDADLAAAEGADFFGVVVDVAFSPRSLSIEAAAPLFMAPRIPAVALVYQMADDRVETLIKTLLPFAVQFLNPADPSLIKRLKDTYLGTEVWQSIHLPRAGENVDIQKFHQTVDTYVAAGVDALLFDTATVADGKMKFGGTGKTSDWQIVKELMGPIQRKVPIWLAGGINPDNVGEALDVVAPYGVDLCSGVEAVPGKKDPEKVRSLMAVIKSK